MSIQYSGNTAIYSLTTGSTTPSSDYEAFVVSKLQLAGWTLSLVSASDIATFTAQPAASSTVTLDSTPNNRTYTFVNSVSVAYDVLIDVDLAHTIQNLQAAINAGAGAGTKYGTGTLAHPTINCPSVTATTLLVTYLTGGSPGNGAAASFGGTSHATWATSTLQGGANNLVSAITPQGLAMRVQIYTVSGSFYNPGTAIAVIPGNRDGTSVPSTSNGWSASGVISPSTTYKMIASKYQFFIFVPGTLSGGIIGNGTGMGVPFITSNLVAPTISAATNATPIVCTISNHGFSNSDTVLIVGGVGNTAINGSWVITRIDANTFSLNTSVGNGTYTANSAYCSDITLGNSICEAIWTSTSGSSPVNFRTQAYVSSNSYSLVNGNGLTNDGSSARMQLVTPASFDNAVNVDLQWYDNTFLLGEPFIMWGVASSATAKIIGQMWDAASVRTALTIDQTASFDNPAHTFWTIGANNHNSLLWATTP